MNEIITERARQVTLSVLADKDLIGERVKLGDCMVGAMAAGASFETAQELSAAAHMDADLRERMVSQGGLLIGATLQIERGGADG